MAKQHFTFTLSAQQVREAIEAYVGLIVDPKTHDIALAGILPGPVGIVAARKRLRKPKVAAVKAAA